MVGDGVRFELCPLRGRQGLLEAEPDVFVCGVEQHHADDLVRVLAGIEPDDQTACGVADEDVGTGDISGVKQRVQIGDHVLRGAWLGNRVAAARKKQRPFRIEGQDCFSQRARTVIGTDAGERGHAGQERRCWLLSSNATVTIRVKSSSNHTLGELARPARNWRTLEPRIASPTPISFWRPLKSCRKKTRVEPLVSE